MPKINREEYEVLKEHYDMGGEWIARDADGLLYYHKERPIKLEHSSDNVWDSHSFPMDTIGDGKKLFRFVKWTDSEPYNIAELIKEYESEETEVKKDIEWVKEEITEILLTSKKDGTNYFYYRDLKEKIYNAIDQLDEPEPKNITLQDVTDKLWELPLNNRTLWLARLNDEFQEGYIVPLGLKTTDGEEQYLTYNGSYFASRRNKYLQQTFDTLEEIPEFYRGLAERVL